MAIRIVVSVAGLLIGLGCPAEEPVRDVAAELKAAHADAERRFEADADDVRALLDRGDAAFFLGRFDDAVRDYDRMIALDATLGPTHWQRGLALHFAGRCDDAAKQFERFYELDKSDRENGIWRFYAQVEKEGVESARKKLLEYVEPDREPLPAIYRLCAGEVTAEEVLKAVEAANVPEAEKQKRRFYSDLYVGLDAAIVRKDPAAARLRLEKAIGNPWPRESGYGPNFMWHVGRLSLERLGEEGKR